MRPVTITKRQRSGLRAEQLSVVWQSASLLLDYPDEVLRGRLPMIRAASDSLPDAIGTSLRAFVTHLETTPLPDAQADYVETFDNRRRCNLFLTYFAHGDTRKRGMALLRFKQRYLAAGYLLDDGELPDHLYVVLEFAATVDQDGGRELMLDHRAGSSCCGSRCATSTHHGQQSSTPSRRPCLRCAATSTTPYAAWPPKAHRRKRSDLPRSPHPSSVPEPPHR